MRVALIMGKGGVGKTTVAAATALRARDIGHRTLVLSTDAAHSLGDVLGADIGHQPIEVVPGLHAQQLDGRRRFEESWSAIRDYVVELLGWAGADGIDAAELTSLPGLDEILALENLRELAVSGDHDLVVVDCAPSAETLRLLSLPDVLRWYIDRLFPTHRRVARLTRPVLRRTTSMPIADDSVFESMATFVDRLDEIRRILSDPAVTAIRLVTTPEDVVVAETRRTHAYLALYGYGVDAIVVNRTITDDHHGTYFDEWRVHQDRACVRLRETFPDTPMLRIPHYATPRIGADALQVLGKEFYGDVDPATAMAPTDAGPTFIRDGDAVTLKIPIPGADADDVRVRQHRDDLFVTVGTHRRAIPLPDALREWHGTSAIVEADHLQVRFERDDRA